MHLHYNGHNKIVHHPFLSKELLSVVSGRDWDGVHRPVITQLNDILYFDTIEMGMEEKLRSAERMAMINGIELRFPFLNHELASFMFSLPASVKIREGYTQFIFRKMMSHYLSADVVWKNDQQQKSTSIKNISRISSIEEFVSDAKQKLVDEKILNTNVLDKRQTKKHMQENLKTEWRYLNAAHLFFNT